MDYGYVIFSNDYLYLFTGNVAFLARGRAEYAALSPLEKKKLATEAASNTLPETLEEKKEYLKQLMRQLHKVVSVHHIT